MKDALSTVASIARVTHKSLRISWRSRLWILLLRGVLKPMMRRFVLAGGYKIARQQLLLASRVFRAESGVAQDYRLVGGCPGHSLGDLNDTDRPVVLWLHGGGFLIPAVPEVHLRLLHLVCRDIDANGFLADYRLAPFNRFPAPLDDVERAYAGLLAMGHDPARIVIAGDSAGGNLALGLLQRIRKAGQPMPACVFLLSPLTEMGRVHAPPSRARNRRRDAVIPIAAMHRIDALYAGGHDAADPELSPLYADFRGFPPLHFVVGDTEVLLDDSLLAANQAAIAGVNVQVDVWPHLPHAFLLFERLFPEIATARTDLVRFVRTHLPST